MKRLLIYTQGTHGHGNLRRSLEIANFLADRNSSLSILIISGSPMIHGFRVSPQVDYIKLPCIETSKNGEQSARLRSLDMDNLLLMRATIITEIVKGFEPLLLLVDKNPTGLGGELNMAHNMMRGWEDPPSRILVLRDILDASDRTKDIWKEYDYYSSVTDHYDEVAVVGHQSIFDVVSEYDFPRDIADKTTYCGYLKRDGGLHCRDQMRANLKISSEPLVVVTVGGGQDGKNVLSHYLDGIAAQPLENGGKSILFLGSEMSRKDSLELKKLALRCENVEINEFSSNLLSYINAADLVVSMGGYNTVCEALSLRKPLIVVPREGPEQEQRIRAESLSARGLLDYIHPEDLSVDGLRALVSRCLKKDHAVAPVHDFEMNGLIRLESLILNQIATKSGAILEALA